MWKKSSEEEYGLESNDLTRDNLTPRNVKSDKKSFLGPNIKIRGVLEGIEDLLIQGEAEGEIKLPNCTVTVGPNGKVSANIHAKIVHVEGQVIGDIVGDEQVSVSSTGNIRGNIVAPTVTLENGAKLKGSIDMESAPKNEAISSSSANKLTKGNNITRVETTDIAKTSS